MSAHRTLPSSPHLGQLKKQAKDLLLAYRAGDPDAQEEFQSHPRSVRPDEAKLTDAQLVLSRSYGYDSWPKLRREAAGLQLRSAIWGRNLKSVKEALTEESDVVNDSGSHPLFHFGRPVPLQLAAERGETEIVRILLEGGADPDSGVDTYGGWTALHLAAHWGHTEVADLLRDNGAVVDIFAACLMGDASAVATILADDPEASTRSGLGDGTPLHFATSIDVAKLLIDHGAELDTVDGMGNNPLGAMIGRGDLCRAVAEYMLEQGAAVDPCILAALGRLDELSHHIDDDPETVHFIGKIGVHADEGTPLHAAVRRSEADVIEMLIARGADVNARGSAGQTPLHLCSDPEIARILVEAGADTEATDDEHGTTPLVWAKVGVEIYPDSPGRAELIAYLSEVNPKS